MGPLGEWGPSQATPEHLVSGTLPLVHIRRLAALAAPAAQFWEHVCSSARHFAGAPVLRGRMAPARRTPAPRTRRRQRPAAPQRQPQSVPRAPSSQQPRVGNLLSRYDARSLGHLPGPRACAPYTVVRERVTFYAQSNISAQNTVLIIGSYVKMGPGTHTADEVTPLVATIGVGTNAPGAQDTLVLSNLFNGAAPQTKSVCLHSLHAEIACTGSAAGVVPSGNVWAGAVTQPLHRVASWANYNQLALSLQTRRSLRMFSAYETMTKPVSLSSYPLDAVAHSEFLWMEGTADQSNELSKAMTPIVVVIGPNAAQTDYTVSLTLEWRVREAVDPILQSTHKQYAPTSESVWGQLSTHLSNAGGFVATTLQDPTVQAAVRGAVVAGARLAPRALALTA